MVNPYNNTLIFGKIPEIYHGRDYFPSGDIYLRYGEHKGINRGFGVAHIWQAHQKELLQLGYTEEIHVSHFVASIIQVGTPLFCEFNDVRGKHRVTVLKSSTAFSPSSTTTRSAIASASSFRCSFVVD
ncbi:hypothetical protein, partial [uncultured Agitococcus sp.]|uniref:hypothetical protein n=1 Tax=uncultured Agitococcus sp. TaxID=1506599 RepID=UPI00261BEC6B